jgi:hypothetical protein
MHDKLLQRLADRSGSMPEISQPCRQRSSPTGSGTHDKARMKRLLLKLQAQSPGRNKNDADSSPIQHECISNIAGGVNAATPRSCGNGAVQGEVTMVMQCEELERVCTRLEEHLDVLKRETSPNFPARQPSRDTQSRASDAELGKVAVSLKYSPGW